MNLQGLRFQQSTEKPISSYFTNLVIETKNAIKLIDTGMHNAYQIMAIKN